MNLPTPVSVNDVYYRGPWPRTQRAALSAYTVYNSGQDSTVTRRTFVFSPDGAGLFDPLPVSLLHELPVDEEQSLIAGVCN